ncbi:hypothetical protein RvY_10764 [Ramazzottius varieornatus]|uniref:Uncharacterized protein n=1 Tax=Ramazzottius varieornatus TaxID=947166 RepID=A0A1D1VIB7_RAMVA|nr:hypothetical protein RvY_10764 [Ramazzottius varieornatus]
MEQIRAMGRWSSDVSNRYVRPDMVSLTQTMLRISVKEGPGVKRAQRCTACSETKLTAAQQYIC